MPLRRFRRQEVSIPDHSGAISERGGSTPATQAIQAQSEPCCAFNAPRENGRGLIDSGLTLLDVGSPGGYSSCIAFKNFTSQDQCELSDYDLEGFGGAS